MISVQQSNILGALGHVAEPDVGGPLDGVGGEIHAIPNFPLPIGTVWPKFSAFAAAFYISISYIDRDVDLLPIGSWKPSAPSKPGLTERGPPGAILPRLE